MTKTIGVIGLGSIGTRHKTNLWKELGQTEVIGYDPDPTKQNGTGWVIGDLDKMIEMSDILIIASPTPNHYEHLVKACMTNKPIFIEKPIADTPAVHHLTHLIATRPFMVGYNLRFHSCVKKAKEWMNEIGKPLWANITLGQHSEKPPYVRDGVILNWSHEIDLALYLLGPGHVLTSSTRVSNGKDDVSDILLQHNSGCRSLVHLDYVTRPEIRQTLIVGSKATIIIDLVNRMAWLRGSDDVILDQFQGLDTWQMNYVEEMQEFLGLCDGEKSIGCTGKEALAVLDICLEVRKQAGL